uniref:Uncharacterized protein n=1 Tax=Strigamia maritima TaxID=126957 RepID=T1JGG6_STRMM
MITDKTSDLVGVLPSTACPLNALFRNGGRGYEREKSKQSDLLFYCRFRSCVAFFELSQPDQWSMQQSPVGRLTTATVDDYLVLSSHTIVWMQKPGENYSNCPPGLEYLGSIDQIMIRQQIEMSE